jgi:hypothetical protein
MTKDENLTPILNVIFQISEDFSTMRFGEIIQNAVDHKYKSHNNNFLDKSSKQILNALADYYKYLKVKKDGN